MQQWPYHDCSSRLLRNGKRWSLFRKAGELNKNGVPGFAIVVQGVWSVLLCLSGTYGNLLDYVIFAVLIFFTLTILAIFILR